MQACCTARTVWRNGDSMETPAYFLSACADVSRMRETLRRPRQQNSVLWLRSSTIDRFWRALGYFLWRRFSSNPLPVHRENAGRGEPQYSSCCPSIRDQWVGEGGSSLYGVSSRVCLTSKTTHTHSDRVCVCTCCLEWCTRWSPGVVKLNTLINHQRSPHQWTFLLHLQPYSRYKFIETLTKGEG